jgi:myosin-5
VNLVSYLIISSLPFTKNQATIIQKYVRGWLARIKYRRSIKRIVLIQCLYRRRIARRILRQLKTEAKSVEFMKNLNKGLENKIISLQQKINELVSLITALFSKHLSRNLK